MRFYLVKDFSSPMKITDFKLEDNGNDCDDMYSDSTENYIGCANGFYGFYIIDIRNI